MNKFRVWDGKKFLSQDLVCMDGSGNLGVIYEDCPDTNDYTVDWEYALLAQMSTGVLDIEGKEIYEGDILEIKPEFMPHGKHSKVVGPTITIYGTVEFKLGAFKTVENDSQWNKRKILGNASGWYRTLPDLHECKIVGNIYENPTFLKEQDEEA